jgi:hypothetical protein
MIVASDDIIITKGNRSKESIINIYITYSPAFRYHVYKYYNPYTYYNRKHIFPPDSLYIDLFAEILPNGKVENVTLQPINIIPNEIRISISFAFKKIIFDSLYNDTTFFQVRILETKQKTCVTYPGLCFSNSNRNLECGKNKVREGPNDSVTVDTLNEESIERCRWLFSEDSIKIAAKNSKRVQTYFVFKYGPIEIFDDNFTIRYPETPNLKAIDIDSCH